LRQGREIEFYYRDKKYSFSHNEDGYYITEYNNDNFQSFDSPENLITNGTISGKFIRDIWKDVIIDVLF
jgi:hypothetical protein